MALKNEFKKNDVGSVFDKYPVGTLVRHVASQRRGVVYQHFPGRIDHNTKTSVSPSVSIHWDGGLSEGVSYEDIDVIVRKEAQ